MDAGYISTDPANGPVLFNIPGAVTILDGVATVNLAVISAWYSNLEAVYGESFQLGAFEAVEGETGLYQASALELAGASS